MEQPQQGKEITPTHGAESTKASNKTRVQDMAESFALVSKYGDEYMDDIPLVGEPGSFILSRAGDASSTTGTTTSSVKPAATSVVPSRTGTPGMARKGTDQNNTGSPSLEGDKSKRKKSRS